MCLRLFGVSLLSIAKPCLIVIFAYWSTGTSPSKGSEKHEEKSYHLRPSLEQGGNAALRVSKRVNQSSASQKNAFVNHDADFKSSLSTIKSSQRLKPLAPFVYPVKEPVDETVEKEKITALMAEVYHLYESLRAQSESEDREKQEAIYAQLRQIEQKIAEQRKIDVSALTDKVIPLQSYIVKQEEIFGDMFERMPGFKVRKTLKKYNDLNLWLIVRLTLLKHESDTLCSTFGPSFFQSASSKALEASTSSPLYTLKATLKALHEEERFAEKTYTKAPVIDFERPLLLPSDYIHKEDDIFTIELSEHDARKKLQSTNHLTLRLIAHLNVLFQNIKLEKATCNQESVEKPSTSSQDDIEVLKKQIALLSERLAKIEIQNASDTNNKEDKSAAQNPRFDSIARPFDTNDNNNFPLYAHEAASKKDTTLEKAHLKETLTPFPQSTMSIEQKGNKSERLPSSVAISMQPYLLLTEEKHDIEASPRITKHAPAIEQPSLALFNSTCSQSGAQAASLESTRNNEEETSKVEEKIVSSALQQELEQNNQESLLTHVASSNASNDDEQSEDQLHKKKKKRKARQPSKAAIKTASESTLPQIGIKLLSSSQPSNKNASLASRYNVTVEKKDHPSKKNTKIKPLPATVSSSLKIEETSDQANALSLNKVHKKERALQNENEAKQAYEIIIRSTDNKECQTKVQWLKDAAEQNHRGAQNVLSRMYFKGEVLPQNYKEALKWAKRAAVQGDLESMRRLGDIHYKGLGYEPNYREALQWYRKAASHNDADALYALGLMHYEGHGIKQDYTQAAQLYLKAAQHGHQDAQKEIGCMYYEGQGIEQNYAEAARWLKASIPEGKGLKHCYYLGLMYYHGRGLPQDSEQAALWFTKAADNNYADAQNKLGFFYLEGRGTVPDYVKAAQWLKKAAEQGRAEAQNELGFLYGTGLGVTQDYRLALKWYKKSAKQGWTPAFINIGTLYCHGFGVERDNHKAAEWFLKAAEKDDVQAQYLLGLIYVKGNEKGKDATAAAYWFEKAAKHEHAKAQKELAVLYYVGFGIDQDYSKAVQWYEKSATQGYSEAQISVGFLYYSGEGVAQDYNKAAYWYRQAAEQGNALAQNSLGDLYQNGQGVPQDYEEAVYWYKKAAEQGYKVAQERLKVLQKDGYWCVIQ